MAHIDRPLPPHADTPAPDTSPGELDNIKLRSFSPVRAVLTGMALAAGMAWVVFMVFGSRVAPAPPPDPIAAEAAFADKVTGVLEAARPPGEPLMLPESTHSRGGLLLPQATTLRSVTPSTDVDARALLASP